MGGIVIKRGAAYEVSLYARCIDGKKKQLTVALVDQEGLPIAQAKLKVQGPDWAEYKAQLVITDKYKGELGKDTRFALLPKGRKR